jgi:hypothetical protein
MLTAKRRTSLFNQDTSVGGYSKPTPGPDIFTELHDGIKSELHQVVELGSFFAVEEEK